MSLWSHFKLPFWDHPPGFAGTSLNYRRMWQVNFGVALVITLLPPLLLASLVLVQMAEHARLERRGLEERLTARLAVAGAELGAYLGQRREALRLLQTVAPPAAWEDPASLARLRGDLNRVAGGFEGLTLWGPGGRKLAQAGQSLPGPQAPAPGETVFQAPDGAYYLGLGLPWPLALGGEGVLEAALPGREALAALTRLARDPEGRAQSQAQNQAQILVRGGALPPGPPWDAPAVRQSLAAAHPGARVLEARDATGRPCLVGLWPLAGTELTLALALPPGPAAAGLAALRVWVLVAVLLGVLAVAVAVYLGTARQVSRLYQADLERSAVFREIVYTHKLASVGRLAAGVAHEINNPMAVINEKIGLINDLILMHGAEADPERLLSLLEVVKNSVKRVSRVTHRLLGFAQHLPQGVESLDLGELLRGVLAFLAREAEVRHIDIDLQVAPDLPAVSSDRGLLEQVFLNIINNALAVLDDGGRLEIKVSQSALEDLEVTIADNGRGISPEDLQHIFEPFFTTQGTKGTGLGLSITYGIVHKLGGRISVESKQGRGTAFKVSLPPVTLAPAEQPPDAREVDQEIGVRAMLARGPGD
ncbi:MAG: hypothetical protein KQJ78_12830 [Deltaproteobacteria bacterium]|nr:hypothetical protein [Deltaproteobacteria bacterium]